MLSIYALLYRYRHRYRKHVLAITLTLSDVLRRSLPKPILLLHRIPTATIAITAAAMERQSAQSAATATTSASTAASTAAEPTE